MKAFTELSWHKVYVNHWKITYSNIKDSYKHKEMLRNIRKHVVWWIKWKCWERQRTKLAQFRPLTTALCLGSSKSYATLVILTDCGNILHINLCLKITANHFTKNPRINMPHRPPPHSQTAPTGRKLNDRFQLNSSSLNKLVVISYK